MIRSVALLLISMLLLPELAGCGKKSEEASKGETPAPVGQLEINVAEAGTISGSVSYSGEVPERKELPYQGNPECSTIAHGGIFSEDLLVQEGKLENAVVYIEKGLENYTFPTPTEAVIIDNIKCVYVPHVSAAQTGQPVTFVNRDPTLHNIHAFPKNQAAFNMGLPFEGMKQTRKFTVEEVAVPLKCDVHPWMIGYLAVLAHPYFQVTGEDGSFSLKNVPPGDYVLEVWHEKLGTKELAVTVAARETKELEVEYSVISPAPD